MYAYTHSHVHLCMQYQLVKNEAMNLVEIGEGCIEGFGGRKGKGKIIQLYYNVKTKRNNFGLLN